MKKIECSMKCFLVLFFCSNPVLAFAAVSASDIMNEVRAGTSFDNLIMKQSISTCSYRAVGSKIRCKESPAKKSFYSFVRSREDESPEKSRSLVLLREPASEMGVSLLQIDYNDTVERASDQWIYIPAFNKIKKVYSGEKSSNDGGVFGSEIEVDDLKRQPSETLRYDFSSREDADETKYWVIEAVLDNGNPIRGKYKRYEIYIDKKSYTVDKQVMFDRWDNVHKELVFRDYEIHEGKKIAKRIIVNNLQRNRVTVLDSGSYETSVELKKHDVSKKTMTDPSKASSLINRANDNDEVK